MTDTTTQTEFGATKNLPEEGINIAHVSWTAKQYVAPGRSFAAAYARLGNAEKSSLRHGDPYLMSAFWACLSLPKEIAQNSGISSKNIKLMETTLAAMAPFLTLRQDKFVACGKDIGALLKSQKLSGRRVEAVLTENNLAILIDGLDGALNITEGQLDFGVLLGNLMAFQMDAGEERRHWARSLYSSKFVEH